MKYSKVKFYFKKIIFLLWGFFDSFKSALSISRKYSFIKNELMKLHISDLKIYLSVYALSLCPLHGQIQGRFAEFFP